MQKIECEVCGSGNIVKNGHLFVCLNCGCRYFPDSQQELSYLQEEDAPSIQEILAHKGLNPVNVTKKNGIINIVDEFTGRNYTAEQYRAHVYELTHKPSMINRIWRKIKEVFTSFDWNIESIAKFILVAIIPLFLIIGVLSIRNGASLWVIIFQFLIAISAAIHFGTFALDAFETKEFIFILVNLVVQILLNHFILFGSLFSLELIWRIIIGIILKITGYWVTNYLINEA